MRCAKCRRKTDGKHKLIFRDYTPYGYMIEREFLVCDLCTADIDAEVDDWGTLNRQDYIAYEEDNKTAL